MPSTWTPGSTARCMEATGLVLCGKGVPVSKPLMHLMVAEALVVLQEAAGVLRAAVVVLQVGQVILQAGLVTLQVVVVIGGVRASQAHPPQVLPLVELKPGKVGGR